MEKKKLLFVGLPESGKTTYLAALWQLLNTSDSIFKIKNLNDDLNYLESIAENWRDFETIPRTNDGNFKNEISLQKSEGTIELDLVIPDYKGEHFKNLLIKRSIDNELMNYINETDNIFLFISYSDIENAVNWDDAQLDLTNKNQSGESYYKSSCTQARITELLQLINYLREYKKINIVVLITAWDLVPSLFSQDPTKFLTNNFPLFLQYLNSNKNFINFNIYGISSQGTSYDKTQDIEKLKKLSSEKRVKIVHSEDKKLDFLEPISWILKHQ